MKAVVLVSPALAAALALFTGCSGHVPLDPAELDHETGLAEEATGSVESALSFSADLDRALIEGTGCTAATTLVRHEGGRLHVTFTDLGLGLYPGDEARAGRSACVIRIPVTVPPSHYVSEVTQRAHYDVYTTSGGRASLATNSAFAGLPMGATSKHFEGRTDAIATLERTSTLRGGIQCATKATEGMLAINLAVTASRAAEYDTAHAYIDSFTFDTSRDVLLARCTP
jgi:hypothetical protein